MPWATTAKIMIVVAEIGVQPKEGMETVEKHLVCVSLPFVTNKLHGAGQDKDSSELRSVWRTD